MPSALETLVKILKLEQDTGYKNTAVIGGLQSYAGHWQRDAHQQAKRPEHHQLVDELIGYLEAYPSLEATEARHDAIKHMLGRIMGRIPGPAAPPSTPASAPPPAPPSAPPPTPKPAAARPPSPPPSLPPAPPAPRTRRKPEPDDEELFEDNGEGLETSEDIEDLFGVEFRPVAPHIETPATPPVSPRRTRQEMPSLADAVRQMQELRASTTQLHKVGKIMAEKLQKLGIETIEEMLYTFPRRFDDYTRMRTLNQVRQGEVVTVAAAVESVVKKQGKGGQSYLLLTLDDGTNCLQVTFFGQPWLQRQFKRDSQLVLSGKVDLFRGQLMMTNPEWELLERENLHTGRIVPVYRLTKGLSARTMRRLMHQVVDEWSRRVPEYLPSSVLDRSDLVGLGWALEQMHFPDSFDALNYARARLGFDELFIFQTAMLSFRREWQIVPGQPMGVDDEWLNHFWGTLPFPLTNAQQRVISEIRADMAKPVAMNRLLQGDVGSGKTVVAATAMAIAAIQGKQAALMAPTSILAEQHARSIGNLLRSAPGGENIQVRLLTGSTSDDERNEILRGLAEGWIQVVIGTHALIQQGVNFQNLGLVVIDEQHRFGVEQRGGLRGKGTNPHVLVMTATPIPRTLALTVYADLDLSIIDEMPAGRAPIETRVINPVQRERAYSFIRSQLDQGRQAFIVYPLVETSEALDEVGAAVDAFAWLQKEVFSRYRVGLLHGRMKPAEKEEVMAAFSANQIQVLVSTSVIEVGIDVPNATVILIENAERFGLAQLHQFRGRVGRGEYKSYCLLTTTADNPEAEHRLNALEETMDGFKLAEIDWNMRGSGDLLGLQQSGGSQFRLAEWITPSLVELAQREARTVYAEDPDLSQPEHLILAQRVQIVLESRGADVS